MSNSNVYYVGGSKGGVGKSLFSFALVDYLLNKDKNVLLVDKYLPCRAGNAVWINLIPFAPRWSGKPPVVRTCFYLNKKPRRSGVASSIILFYITSLNRIILCHIGLKFIHISIRHYLLFYFRVVKRPVQVYLQGDICHLGKSSYNVLPFLFHCHQP